MSSLRTTMPWGKFRGWLLTDITSSYLCWVLESAEYASPVLRAAIQDVLQTRFGSPTSAPPPPPRRGACPDTSLASEIVSAGVRTLAKRHHPDVGGDTATMQKLNATADWLKGTVQR
jgi:hypothetical protein